MPPKRKSSLGRNTANSKRLRQIRSNENSSETQIRLSKLAIQRANYTDLQREKLNFSDRERHATSRNNETLLRRSIRLEEDRIRHTQSRSASVLHSSDKWSNKQFSALHYDLNIDYENDDSVCLRKMDNVCKFCSALKFKAESAGMCCQNGKVKLPALQSPPEPLLSLLSGQHALSNEFLKGIRSYNSAFQMTSFGAKQVKEPGFMPTFKIQGQVHHVIGSILPVSEGEQKFLQMYFISDHNTQVSARCNNVQNLNRELVQSLQDMLHERNNYIRSFKYAFESIPPDTTDFKIVIHADKKLINQHEGRYNAPITDEVAILIVGQEFGPRDIILSLRDESKKRISELHRSYDALQYPLLLCRGEDGYSISIHQTNPLTGESLKKTVSCMNFYAYRMMVRANEFNTIVRFGMLTNQFWVDQYAKIESERLSFIRRSQSQLRAENYIHLRDALRSDENSRNLGQLVILPSSFTAGPRYMHERTQDAMTYVRNYGKPDLFVTFTCNPNWSEIKDYLYPNTTPQNRYDLISRIFHLKLQKLMILINKGEVFGKCKCYMYTVEWQKRGLPHAHLLIWLTSKIRSEQIDDVIWAEIPNSSIDPQLHQIVAKHMVHGPCGTLNTKSPCMKDGVCSKRFPKTFCADTSTQDDGYPKYRRRQPVDGGHTLLRSNGINIDNRWIVPFNPVLLKTFNCHINVEYCSSVKAIKYVCKYINKGSDQATFTINAPDEVELFQSGRYISSSEAVWRILGFSIHERSPAVIHLAVHLENGQRVYFTPDNVDNIVANPRDTTLIGFFKLCAEDPFARTLLYCEVPTYYTWVNNKFQRRKQGAPVDGFPGIRRSNILGRVYTIHPSNSECYYLRLLLHNIRGPTSFKNLLTIKGIEQNSFQSACRSLGLLENDSHWDDTLKEASLSKSPTSIRSLFSMMLSFCHVSDPVALWDRYKEVMSEDILYRNRQEKKLPEMEYSDIIFDETLITLEKDVQSMTGKSIRSMGLPLKQTDTSSSMYMNETSFDMQALRIILARNEHLLNSDQKHVYKNIVNSAISQTGNIYFLDAPGGTGKTFLINLLLAKVRSSGLLALAVASSGIAATLLDGGRTAHAMFKLPLDVATDAPAVCNISKQSNISKMLQRCSLIVWDESTMSNKLSIEALDRTLKDIRNDNRIMGGVTMLFAGDFRQTLPVVPRGTRADEVNACLKKSYIWASVKILTLKINMRAKLFNESGLNHFSDQLLKLGNGVFDVHDGYISIENVGLCTIVKDIETLINIIYPEIGIIHSQSPVWFRERAILAPKNDAVESINNLVLNKFDAVLHTYKAIDSVIEEQDAVHYPIEFLNSLNPPGMSLHTLNLKVGAPIILIRNLKPPQLCNGTRLKIDKLFAHIIEATILTGCGAGESVLIPRIPLISVKMPFQFKRLQFPIKLCFAMTINKAQGQTLKVAGVDLSNPCFSHGQLYVAFSRISSSNNLYVFAPDGKTKNIVYKEALS